MDMSAEQHICLQNFACSLFKLIYYIYVILYISVFTCIIVLLGHLLGLHLLVRCCFLGFISRGGGGCINLLFIQNISLFLIGLKPPANSS